MEKPHLLLSEFGTFKICEHISIGAEVSNNPFAEYEERDCVT